MLLYIIFFSCQVIIHKYIITLLFGLYYVKIRINIKLYNRKGVSSVIKALSLARNLIRLNFCLHRRSCDRCRFHYSYKSCYINVDFRDSVIVDKTISRLIEECCSNCLGVSRTCPMCGETSICTINNYMPYIKRSKDMGRGAL